MECVTVQQELNALEERMERLQKRVGGHGIDAGTSEGAHEKDPTKFGKGSLRRTVDSLERRITLLSLQKRIERAQDARDFIPVNDGGPGSGPRPGGGSGYTDPRGPEYGYKETHPAWGEQKKEKLEGGKKPNRDAGTSEGARKAAQTRNRNSGGAEGRLKRILETQSATSEARKKVDKHGYSYIRKTHPEIFGK